MAQGDTHMTIIGNAVADPELRYTSSGTPVANIRVASNPRRFDKQTNQWVDGDPVYMTVNAWRGLAENVAASVSKGTRIIATGILQQREFETRDGQRRSSYEIAAEDIGYSMTFSTLSSGPSATGGKTDHHAGGNDPWATGRSGANSPDDSQPPF